MLRTVFPASSHQYLSKDIRDLQVMQDRVLADNPLEDETELPLGEIVPAEWRVVVLEHTDPNGTRHIIERGSATQRRSISPERLVPVS